MDAGLQELGVALSPDARDAIDGHVRLLLAWNAAINLTAVRDPVEVARRHVLDSLAAIPELRRLGVRAFVDIGSGGGFPGIPLAAALPAEHSVLVESIRKKAGFLETVAAATGLSNVRVEARRAEDLAAEAVHRERWPAVLARAVGGLAELVELAFPLLERRGSLIAWKGDLPDDELEAGRRAVDAMGGGRVRIVPAGTRSLPGHRLVVATKRDRTGEAYPRSPSARRRRPW
ncbi:MAG TPA: 16S rRNA (guanine(527)-N(7))-methyltransferase RsmG [Candidatus Limnocylindrales bacterium]|nr:16S rRNA (guanine(527)-N(7))-methyltransferase RsmG [Candidatus Limnocylindrales bacterium]